MKIIFAKLKLIFAKLKLIFAKLKLIFAKLKLIFAKSKIIRINLDIFRRRSFEYRLLLFIVFGDFRIHVAELSKEFLYFGASRNA